MMKTDTERKEESTTGTERLRIAAYGFVHRDAGSVASASHLFLKELLARGHEVDFYTIEGFVDPVELRSYANYSCRASSIKWISKIWWLLDNRAPRFMKKLSIWLFSQVSDYFHRRNILRDLRLEHARRPYDFSLFLGLTPPFRLADAPCVSWPQGSPNGEIDAIRSLRKDVIRYGGLHTYLLLELLYWVKKTLARIEIKRSDLIFCGGPWTLESLVRLGAERSKIHVLFYPIDLDEFAFDESRLSREGGAEDASEPLILWLGRIVPRKRLDLALEGFRRLKESGKRGRLLIIGRFSYAVGYRKMLREYEGIDGLEYQEAIPRSEVPALMRRVSVIFQPSENENFGSTVIEGLAFGIPSVLGPTNDTRHCLGESSVVFREYTPESVAAGLAELIDRVERDRGAIAVDCRAAAERNLSVSVVVDRALAIIHKTCLKSKIP